MDDNPILKFMKNLGIGTATQIVRGWLNDALKDITPSDLYEAILENQDLWAVTPEDMKGTGHKFKNTFGNIFDKYENEITTELLLKWMKEDHLELYSTIINTTLMGNNQAGILWFDTQVNKIKQKIKEM